MESSCSKILFSSIASSFQLLFTHRDDNVIKVDFLNILPSLKHKNYIATTRCHRRYVDLLTNIDPQKLLMDPFLVVCWASSIIDVMHLFIDQEFDERYYGNTSSIFFRTSKAFSKPF